MRLDKFICDCTGLTRSQAGKVIRQKLVTVNGEIAKTNVMKVTLSCDHRVVDGVVGSKFLNTLKDLLEEPVKMLV